MAGDERAESVGVQHQRGRVAAVDHVDHRVVVRDVEQDGCDERLSGVVGPGVVRGPAEPVASGLPGLLGQLGEVPADAAVQVGGQVGQLGVQVGGGAEGAEQQGRVAERGQALAAYVADQQPGAGGGAGGRVQVAADLCLGLGGEVDGGQVQRPDPVRQRAQQDPLGGLGHRPDPGQFAFVPLAQHPQADDQRGDGDLGAQLGLVVGGGEAVPGEADDGQRGEREQGDPGGGPGAGEGSGQGGGDDQQRAEVDVRRGEDVDDGDRRDQRERQRRQHPAVGPPGAAAVGGVRRVLRARHIGTLPEGHLSSVHRVGAGAHPEEHAPRGVRRAAFIEERSSRSADRGVRIEERSSRSAYRGACAGRVRPGSAFFAVAGQVGGEAGDVFVGPVGEALGEGQAALLVGVPQQGQSGLGGAQDLAALVVRVGLAGQQAELLQGGDLAADGGLVEHEVRGHVGGPAAAALGEQVEDAVGDQGQVGVQLGGLVPGAAGEGGQFALDGVDGRLAAGHGVPISPRFVALYNGFAGGRTALRSRPARCGLRFSQGVRRLPGAGGGDSTGRTRVSGEQ